MKVDDLTQPLTIPLRRRSRALEFTLADFDMPVVHESLAARVSEQCEDDVQLFPAAVEGTVERYYIMNITNTVPCLDEKKSGVTYWGEQDGRPDLVGKYMIVGRQRKRFRCCPLRIMEF
jgi:hypothetical protein